MKRTAIFAVAVLMMAPFAVSCVLMVGFGIYVLFKGPSSIGFNVSFNYPTSFAVLTLFISGVILLWRYGRAPS
ncbi:MAG: hypothetical protein JST51_00800 [Armatimonadetes bacterium]|nr:hypothetical protein [Armatimonadota bacterium]